MLFAFVRVTYPSGLAEELGFLVLRVEEKGKEVNSLKMTAAGDPCPPNTIWFHGAENNYREFSNFWMVITFDTFWQTFFRLFFFKTLAQGRARRSPFLVPF